MSDVSDAILELRTRLRLTQTRFAQALGVSLVTVARNEAGNPVRASNLISLHKIAVENKHGDLASRFRESLKSIKGRAAMRAESVMTRDLLDYQRRIWKESLAQMEESLATATGEERRVIELNIPDYQQRISDLTDAIDWHKARHDRVKPSLSKKK